jgi:hypothetical protein
MEAMANMGNLGQRLIGAADSNKYSAFDFKQGYVKTEE